MALFGRLRPAPRPPRLEDFGFAELTGAIAWWLWGVVHVGFLVGVRSRVSVALDWFWSYLTYRSGTRLITGAQASGSVRKGSDPPRTTTPPARLEASAAMPTS